jgi:hypothetical protein
MKSDWMNWTKKKERLGKDFCSVNPIFFSAFSYEHWNYW